MDDPLLDEQMHMAALRDLERLNKMSRGETLLWQPLKELAKQSTQKLRVLDLATGGGDNPLCLSKRALQENIQIQIDGSDFSNRAVEHARSRAAAEKSDDEFFRLDVFADEFPQDYDVIMCSLFTHHLDAEEVIRLLAKMAASARKAIIINDLMRSRLNLLLVQLSTRLFCSSPIVQYDGPVSVRAAYTLKEMREMANKAGLTGFSLSEHFPCRMMLDWRRS